MPVGSRFGAAAKTQFLAELAAPRSTRKALARRGCLELSAGLVPFVRQGLEGGSPL